MPTTGGPNTLGESNLVFAYDVADTRNSYIGEPTVNQYTNPDFSNGTTGWAFYSWDGNVTYTTEAVTGPFGKTINALKLTKNSSSSHSHFHQYNSGKYTTGNQYTLSAWVKGTGTFRGNTQWGGIVQSFTLTGDWQYVQYTVTAPNNDNYPYWAAEALTTGTVFYMVYAQSEQKSHATPFVNGTRSATQGLLPLIGNSTLDLTNMSFDSNAKMVFDGTNDYISCGTLSLDFSQGITAEVVANFTNTGTWQRLFDFGNGAGSNNILFARYSSTNYLWFEIYNGGSSVSINTAGGIINNQTCHYVVTVNGSIAYVYRDGVLINSGTFATVPTTISRTNCYIGKSNWADSYFQGDIPIVKMYNRALTAQEVKQNYQQYKTRFNLR